MLHVFIKNLHKGQKIVEIFNLWLTISAGWPKQLLDDIKKRNKAFLLRWK